MKLAPSSSVSSVNDKPSAGFRRVISVNDTLRIDCTFYTVLSSLHQTTYSVDKSVFKWSFSLFCVRATKLCRGVYSKCKYLHSKPLAD
jgi:hypothetical protein